MSDISFTDILRNQHFSQFVAILSIPYRSSYWRRHHAKVPFWARVERLTRLLHGGGLAHRNIQAAFLNEFTQLIVEIVENDPKIYYRKEDMDWFLGVLDGEYANVTMSMLFAMASSKPAYVTPAQVAEATGTHESGWRNKSASGELVGAFKAGKQWLIPTTSLRAYGIAVDIPPVEYGETEESEENTMVSPAKWIGGELFELVCAEFKDRGYAPPTPDTPGGTGAYAMNIAKQYTADLSEKEVLEIIAFAGDNRELHWSQRVENDQ